MERQLTVQINCDKTVPANQRMIAHVTNCARCSLETRGTVVIDSAYETEMQCRYRIVARSSAGCGVLGDPFECASPSASEHEYLSASPRTPINTFTFMAVPTPTRAGTRAPSQTPAATNVRMT
jgi:hypothetical protein